MNFNFKRLHLVVVAAAFAAQAASAATAVPQPTTIIYGGGATLPANAYIGTGWLNAVPNLRLSNTLPPPAGIKTNAFAATATSLFAQYALSTAATVGSVNYKAGTVGVSYCQTGSGTGRRTLTNQGGFLASAQCGDYSSGALGFSAPAGQSQPDFAASDAPLSQGDINAFATTTAGANYSSTRTQVVQIPAVAGAVAVVYNNSDLLAAKKQLNLTQSDICGIFSGQITNWSQLTHTPKFGTVPSKPIKLVYRNDGSGTTFSFTNYLSQVCGTVSRPGDTAVSGYNTTDTFQGGSNLTNSPAANLSSAALNSAGASGQNGNGNVVGYVAANDGAIGYAEIADAVARAKVGGGGNLKYATVSFAADLLKTTGTLTNGQSTTCPAGTPGTATSFTNTGVKPLKYTCAAVTYNKLDPVKNFPAAYAATANGDDVITPDVNGRPVVAARNDVSPSGFVPGCLLLVEPDSYAAPATGVTKKASSDYAIYPITAISYLLANGTGNGAKTAAIQGLLSAAYTPAIKAKVKTIGAKTGFAPLSLTIVGGAASTAVDTISACVRN